MSNLKASDHKIQNFRWTTWKLKIKNFKISDENLGGVQNLEWSNVERPIFQNVKITNIKIAEDELFDYFIYEFIFYYYYFLIIWTLKIFDSFSKFYRFSKLLNFGNFLIFRIKK